MNKLILLFIFCFFWIFSNQNTYANVTVNNETNQIENKTTMEVIWNTVFVEGDLYFPSYRSIPYNFEINGNLSIWDGVKLLWEISVHWDIDAGNELVVYKTISWNNITIWNKSVIKKIISYENITLNWYATIAEWMIAGWDVDVWWNFNLYGNSTIEWDLQTELDINIFGNLYVYWDIRSKERFHFQWEKLKIYGDFRTLQESKLEGRIFIYGSPARRSYYTNKIKYNYILKSEKYTWFMWKIDPVLQYNLSDNDIKNIYSRVSELENKIEEQKRKIAFLPYGYSEEKTNQEINNLKSIENNLITFIDTYISTHSRDIQEWNIIKFERQKELESYLKKYL